jgi:RimJ/RimL family protein N-acetyltransferase
MSQWEQRAAGLEAPLGLWAIVPAGSGGVPVGTVLLMPLNDEAGLTGEIEIGWHLHPDSQGRGLATDAARLLLGAARAAGIARVRAVTDLDNSRSQAVATRLGMIDAGITDRWFGMPLREYLWPDPCDSDEGSPT